MSTAARAAMAEPIHRGEPRDMQNILIEMMA
ncbi:hypothetical protein J2S09_003938 [Bacillus fengqiuensis]|nr:hypothetical protein [Bacillus fengqiuensis]